MITESQNHLITSAYVAWGTIFEGFNIFVDFIYTAASCFCCSPANVWCDKNLIFIFNREKRTVRRHWFNAQYVKTCSSNSSLIKGICKSGFIYNWTPCKIKDYCFFFYLFKSSFVNKIIGYRCERTVNGYNV